MVRVLVPSSGSRWPVFVLPRPVRVKEDLQALYDKLNYTKKAKANDLEEYFELKECKVLNSETGKYDRGYELIKKKD